MDAQHCIRLLTQAQEDSGPPPPFVRRSVDLPVRDEILHVACDVPDRPMRLAEIVPFVHEIDDRLMAMYLRQAAEEGLTIFCRKGCDACCHRYLVVFSPAGSTHFLNHHCLFSFGKVASWLPATQ